MRLSEDKARENILRGNGRRDCDDKMNEQRERERGRLCIGMQRKKRDVETTNERNISVSL